MDHSPNTTNDDRVLAATAILAPAALLLSYVALPRLFMETGDQLGSIASSHTRYYLFLLFGIVAQTLLIPATYLIVKRTGPFAPRRAATGGVLAFIGLALGLVDLGAELMKWQMSSDTADRATMASVVDGFDASPGVAALLQGSGLALLIGFILLGLALTASGYPRWVGVSLAGGIAINLAGFMFASTIALIVSAVLLLLGFIRVARSIPRRTTTSETKTATSAPTR
jgi:hypothetical protein